MSQFNLNFVVCKISVSDVLLDKINCSRCIFKVLKNTFSAVLKELLQKSQILSSTFTHLQIQQFSKKKLNE